MIFPGHLGAVAGVAEGFEVVQAPLKLRHLPRVGFAEGDDLLEEAVFRHAASF